MSSHDAVRGENILVFTILFIGLLGASIARPHFAKQNLQDEIENFTEMMSARIIEHSLSQIPAAPHTGKKPEVEGTSLESLTTLYKTLESQGDSSELLPIVKKLLDDLAEVQRLDVENSDTEHIQRTFAAKKEVIEEEFNRLKRSQTVQN